MVQIRVRLFALLRELSGQGEFWLSLSEDASCREALASLETLFDFPEAVLKSCLVAVNGAYAGLETRLRSGDEVAVLPPVSGG